MIDILKTIIYIPLYNFLILILNIDFIDVGIATIIITIVVKFILYPLTKKSFITQHIMKEKNKELLAIKEKYKDKQEQAIKIMEFYKENKINPLSSILILIIQIPIIYSLYHLFMKSGLPYVNKEILYSFISVPNDISMYFLGFFDISKKSLFLALLASISTFFQMHFSNINTNIPLEDNNQDISKIIAKQMKFTLPVVVFFVSWSISGVVSLYWFVSNMVGILQDFYIKKNLK